METQCNNGHETDQPIVCTVFTSHSFNDMFYGKMKNYSESGMYAELQKRFKDGTVLLVRVTSKAPERLPEKIEVGFRSVSLVEVKGSKPLSANGVVCYGTELKHLAIW